MKLTKDRVRHIARLANLNLDEEEIAKLEGQLSETLNFIEKLNQIDTSKVEVTSQVTGLSNVTFPDEIKPSLSQKQALQNAKLTQDGFFKIKAIFEDR